MTSAEEPGPERAAAAGRTSAGGSGAVSFAAIALWVAGAGVLMLALTAAAVAFLPLPPVGRAVVAVAGVLLAVVAMGVASRRVTARAIRAEFGDAADDGTGPGGA